MKIPKKKKPIYPGRLNPHPIFRDERGVSPVIAVILMVAITVVLSAVLYVMVSEMLIEPPDNLQLSMNWEDTGDSAGTYTGYIISSSGESPRLKDVTVSIVNENNIGSETLDVLKAGATLTVGDITLNFYDVNDDDKLGAEDIFNIYGVTDGDIFRLTHEDAGNMDSTIF